MEDYLIDYLSFKYNYGFASGVNVDLFVRNEDRESDLASHSYEENIYGAGLRYFF
jgi:hypothetical protein